MSDDRTKQDWANYRRFVHHKRALDMIFRHASQGMNSSAGRASACSAEGNDGSTSAPAILNADIQYDVDRAADEEGVSVADYLKEPPR